MVSYLLLLNTTCMIQLIFAALVLVQANIIPSFVVEWALCKEQDHPFISGLAVNPVLRTGFDKYNLKQIPELVQLTKQATK